MFVAAAGPPPLINFFFKLDAVLGTQFAVPYLACFFRTFLGGLTTLSTYASLVDLTGRDLSIDCLILAVSVFSFASLSSRQRYHTVKIIYYTETIYNMSVTYYYSRHINVMNKYFYCSNKNYIRLYQKLIFTIILQKIHTMYISRHVSISSLCLFLNSRLE